MVETIVKPYSIGWIVITLGLIALALGVSSCGDDDDPAADQDALVRTWTLGTAGTVKKDDLDVTADYAGLQVTFIKDGTYTAQHAGHLFAPSGTWVRKSSAQLMLDGDFEITIVSVTTTDLSLKLTLNEDDLGGRVKALVGEYDLHLQAR
jgi:hypothetical protein